MTRVLVTHADLPIGRRIVEALWRDPRVERIAALGEAPAPAPFAALREHDPARLLYARVEHTRQRAVAQLLRSAPLRAMRPDAIVHVIRHGEAASAPPVADHLSAAAAEARLVLRQARALPDVRTLVALGSAFVYRLAPGNANHLGEDAPLDLDPALDDARRPWIDADMILRAAATRGRRPRVVLLRLAPVVTSGGRVFLHPLFDGPPGRRWCALGYDPLCPVIADEDVAHAVRRALAGDAGGVFHVAGRDALPLSVLGRWTGRPCTPLPGPLLRALGARGPYLRHGMSLDTRRAAERLGFAPRHRVAPTRGGDGSLRLAARPVRPAPAAAPP